MTQDSATSPAAEVDITTELARELLRRQHPDLADGPIREVSAGWDNVMLRLGETLALRLPRRELAGPLIRNEQRWLPELAPRLPLPIPAPLRVGVPDEIYPFHWSVQPWLRGEAADLAPPKASEAARFAEFFRALHVPPPNDAPRNAHRDCPLSQKQVATEQRMQNLEKSGEPLVPDVMRVWHAALETGIDTPRSWIAGDVHARNVLVEAGKLSAFIDWGDMCAGDPATDLAGIWALFDAPQARRDAIAAYGMSDAMKTRAMGWAVFFGVILLETGLKDTPRHADMGRATLRRLAEDAA